MRGVEGVWSICVFNSSPFSESKNKKTLHIRVKYEYTQLYSHKSRFFISRQKSKFTSLILANMNKIQNTHTYSTVEAGHFFSHRAYFFPFPLCTVFYVVLNIGCSNVRTCRLHQMYKGTLFQILYNFMQVFNVQRPKTYTKAPEEKMCIIQFLNLKTYIRINMNDKKTYLCTYVCKPSVDNRKPCMDGGGG